MENKIAIAKKYVPTADAVVFNGTCLDLMKSIPDKAVNLIVTSPPYNIGKEYEKKVKIKDYIEQQETVIKECYRILAPTGSICWQVGNFVEKGSIIPLDIALYPVFDKLGFKMRNRIIWHFEHGLHCSLRFSGRHETIMWFTKEDKYTFNLDPIRVPQKYPGKKHFKGPKAGQYSCNPLGKNPGDLWQIPNVKNNHPEKTEHPCQFPVELVERLVLSLTNEGESVLDPFSGAGTTIVAAIKNNRKGIGSDTEKKYIDITSKRLQELELGTLKTRPMNKPIYDPVKSNISYLNFVNEDQLKLCEKKVGGL